MCASLVRSINVGGVHSMTTERHSLMANSSTWTGQSAWPIGGTQYASFSLHTNRRATHLLHIQDNIDGTV